MLKGFLSSVVCLVMVGCLLGCAFIEPTTQLRINPITRTIEFTDTKNNDVQVDLIQYVENFSSNGVLVRQFVIDNLLISNNSSEVIEQNVKQMLAFVEQQKAANEGIKVALEGLTNIVGSLISRVNGILQAIGQIAPDISVQPTVLITPTSPGAQP